ncbi:hypothetical protein BBP40_008677 [Aspergillus hancockii]|nr:hypothetical protein BBP40_008677 [Aspergillus hancockii]
MARKRPNSPETQPSQLAKRGRYLNEDNDTTSEYEDVHVIPSSPLSSKDTSESTAHAGTPPRSPRANSGTKSLYTAEFFADMADTIAKLFPFKAFAEAHDCNIGEVSQAVGAMIVGPLSDPSFRWHSGDSISIADYGQSMIETWNTHYEQKLNNADTTATPPSVDEASTPTTLQSSSESDTVLDDESVSSASFDKGYPDVTSIEDEVDTYGSEPFFDLTKEEPQPLKKSRISAQPHKVPDRPLRPPRRVRWAPSPSPVVRKHVYKDLYGNYVELPTMEEKKEMARTDRRQRPAKDKVVIDEPELKLESVDWLSGFEDLSYVV